MKSVQLLVPATSANLGPGFDVLGVALAYYNEIYVEIDSLKSNSRKNPLLDIRIEGEGKDLPRDASNLAVKSVLTYFRAIKKMPSRLKVVMKNRIPLSRGMGSSAAATLGGFLAASYLSGGRSGASDALALAVQMEGHPDNVVPAMAGGFCVSGIVDDTIRYLRWDMPRELQAVVCIPERPLPTAQARAVVPSQFARKDVVFTSSRTAFLIGALVAKKFECLDFGMDDVMHQPYRARLIPGLLQVISDAKKAGAWGAALSGAGSCVLAIVPRGKGDPVGKAMCRRFASHRMKSQALTVDFDQRGAREA